MRDYIISTDSTCDLPKDYIEEHKIFIQPLYYNFEGEVYGGEQDLTPEEFYAKMRSGIMPTTMATNPDFVHSAFTKQVEEGFDVLHISFSAVLSGSCSNATVNAQEVCEEHPDATITVIDSCAASMGQGLLVHKAVMLKEQGKSMEEVATWVIENKNHICHLFTVDDLFHLHRGGRVSRTSAIIGTLINVKPVLHVDIEGRLIPLTNVRGRKKALTKLVDDMGDKITGYENDIVFISHGDCLADAQFVADLIKDRFGIQNFMINFTSPTIGAHSGPGTVALFFMGSVK